MELTSFDNDYLKTGDHISRLRGETSSLTQLSLDSNVMRRKVPDTSDPWVIPITLTTNIHNDLAIHASTTTEDPMHLRHFLSTNQQVLVVRDKSTRTPLVAKEEATSTRTAYTCTGSRSVWWGSLDTAFEAFWESVDQPVACGPAVYPV